MSTSQVLLILLLALIAWVVFQLWVWSILEDLGFNPLERVLLMVGLNIPVVNTFLFFWLVWLWYEKFWRS